MDPDENIEPLSPIEEETRIFNYFKENFTANPKKLKKMAWVHFNDPTIKEFIKNGFLRDILESKDPVKYLRKCFRDIQEWPFIIKDLIESGHHGMLIINDTIHGVKLNTRDSWLRVNDKWNPDDENDIQLDACRGWMAANNKGYFLGKCVLFKEFGFSSIPRVLELKCTKDTHELTRLPGTDYYYS